MYYVYIDVNAHVRTAIPLFRGHLSSGDTFLWRILPFTCKCPSDEGTPPMSMWGHFCCSAEVSPDQRFHCIINYVELSWGIDTSADFIS